MTNKKKIVVIAIPHHTDKTLYLHGLRSDNGKWSLPGGHINEGETPLEAANRELKEETGLAGVKLDLLHEKEFKTDNGEILVHLFCGNTLKPPIIGNDPDEEFLSFKFFNPDSNFNCHVPKERNILLHHLNLIKTKPLTHRLQKNEEQVSEDEVSAHINRTCPHIENPARNARLHAVTSGQDWIKTRIPINSIRVSPHSKRDVNKYHKMILKGLKPPAVVLTSSGKRDDGTWRIISVQDGAHRIAAAKKAGLTHIDAYVGNYTLNKAPIIHDDPKKPMTIIRIQDKEGYGPYLSDADIPWIDERSPDRPTPRSDKGFTKEDVKQLEDEKASNKLFGFKDENEMNKWFNTEQLQDLARFGYKPTKVKASKVWGSGKQVFFEKYVKPLRQKAIKKSEISLTENLEKSLKQKYASMVKDHPQSEELADWAKNNLPNENWGTWYLKNVKNNPAIHNDENKKNIIHYAGMAHLPEVNNVRFDKTTSFDDGIKKLKEAEQQGLNRKVKTQKLLEPEGTQITKEKDGMAWFDLGKGYCQKEAEALGHCGNAGRVDKDKILSLRKITRIGDKTYHQPHLTFIENEGWLGEMKGKGNTKPNQKYHDHIMDLLKLDRIKHIAGGGFLPHSNFSIHDLNEERKNEIKKLKPNIDVWDLPEEEEKKLKINFKHAEDTKELLDYRRYIRQVLKEENALNPENERSLILDHIKNEFDDFLVPPGMALNLIPNMKESEIASILGSEALLEHKSHALAQSKDPEMLDKVLSGKYLDSQSKPSNPEEEMYLQRVALGHGQTNLSHVIKGVNSPHHEVKRYALRNDKLDAETLHNLFLKKLGQTYRHDEDLKSVLLDNKNVSQKTIDSALLNGTDWIKQKAAGLTENPEMIKSVIEGNHLDSKIGLLYNDNLSENDLDKLIDEKDIKENPRLFEKLLSHKSLSAKNFEKALDHILSKLRSKTYTARHLLESSILNNPMLNSDHISKITNAFGGKMPNSISEKLSSLPATKK